MDSVTWRNSSIPHALQYTGDGTDFGCDLESSLPVFLEEKEIRRTVIYHGRKQKFSTLEEQSNTVELSTDQFTPGVLKIFGGTIVPGVEYKSVLASYRSTVPELVKQALERYGLSPALFTDYVLCDVVGRCNTSTLDENGNTSNNKRIPKWQMMCSRVLADSDRPLLLQNFWRPAEGFSRRYELHKKSELSNTLGDDDTMGLNENARKISMSKLRPGAIPFFSHWDHMRKYSDDINVTSQSHPNSHRPPWDSDTYDKKKLIHSLDLEIGNGYSKSLPMPSPRIDYTQENILAPMSCPFLLTLRGFDVNKDPLVHILDSKTTVVHGINEAITTSSIALYDPDVLANHCRLHLKRSSKSRQHCSYEHNYCLEIECSPSSNVKLNGYSVVGRTTVNSGDMFAIGYHYIFLFKDFTAGHEIPRELTWFNPEESQEGHLEKGTNNIVKRHQNVVHVPPLMLGSLNDDNVSVTTVESVGTVESQREKFRFAYSPQQEEDLIKAIGSLIRYDKENFPLTPAYLYSMCIQYACVRFDRHQIRNLLLRILMVVRENVADISKSLKANKFNRAQDIGNSSGLVKTRRSPPANEDFLKDLIQWISNGVQLILYLRGNNFRMNKPRGQKTSPDMTIAFHELATGIEEVVIFTFQQIIYTITKSLYVLLPAVLDGNPFSEDSSGGMRGGGVRKIVTILDNVALLASSLNLHIDVTKQMFMYLFFFCSTTVFNRLFLSDAAPVYYNWSAGVRIRANLGQIEDWACQNAMEEEFGQLFEKLLTAAEFLSTSKTLLVKYDWTMMKRHFRPLNEAQLFRLLSGYFSDQKYIPNIWLPPPEDKQMALQEDDVLLELSGHPAFILPIDGCVIDLFHPPDTSSFWTSFKHLYSLYGTPEEESDIGSSPSNTPRFYGNFPKAELQNSFFRQNAHPKSDTLGQKPNNRKVQFATVETDSSEQTTPRSEQISPRDDLTSGRRSISSVSYDSDVSGMVTDMSNKRKAPPKPKRSPRSNVVSAKIKEITSPLHSPKSQEPADKRNGLHIIKNVPNTLQQNVAVSNVTSKPIKRDQYPSQNYSNVLRNTGRGVSDHDAHYLISTVVDYKMESDSTTADYICDSNSTCIIKGGEQITESVPHRLHTNERQQTPSSQEEKTTEEVIPKDLLVSVKKQITEARKQRNNKQPSPPRANYTAINLTKEENNLMVSHKFSNTNNPVFSIRVSKGESGLGLGLIDGLYTPLRLAGIYIRKILPDSPAAEDGNLSVGDRLLCVNGKSIVGADYQSAMKLIKASGEGLTLMVAKGNASIASKIASTNC